MLAAGLVDLLFVVLFALAYRRTRDTMLPGP
jgi:hypothetical protein